jgi:hypothetical protein
MARSKNLPFNEKAAYQARAAIEAAHPEYAVHVYRYRWNRYTNDTDDEYIIECYNPVHLYPPRRWLRTGRDVDSLLGYKDWGPYNQFKGLRTRFEHCGISKPAFIRALRREAARLDLIVSTSSTRLVPDREVSKQAEVLRREADDLEKASVTPGGA